jgi:uncharacterized protein YkwD
VPRHRAVRPRRPWFLGAAAVTVLAVALGGYFALTGHGTARSAADSRPRLIASPGCAATGSACVSVDVTRGGSPGSVATSPAEPAPSRSRSRSPRPSSAPPAGHSSPAVTPSPAISDSDSAVAAVLALINQARAQAGLRAYTALAGLVTSAGRHNQLMADGCGLSHQCPGEAALGQRETDAGVQWTAAGENIGEGGPVADDSAAITQMADALTQDMLNEKPPDDGHRLNILSSSFTEIGIVVQRGSDGTVWMTQDFAN